MLRCIHPRCLAPCISHHLCLDQCACACIARGYKWCPDQNMLHGHSLVLRAPNMFCAFSDPPKQSGQRPANQHGPPLVFTTGSEPSGTGHQTATLSALLWKIKQAQSCAVSGCLLHQGPATQLTLIALSDWLVMKTTRMSSPEAGNPPHF